MLAYKKKMFHHHRIGIHENMWEEGNVIKNNKSNFKSYFTSEGDKFGTYFNFGDKKAPLSEILIYFSEYKEQLSTEGYRDLLIDTANIINEMNSQKREHALEMVRLKYYPKAISRMNAIWVCDEKGIDYWKKRFSLPRQLYEVEVTGRMFVTSNKFLPPLDVSFNEMLDYAHEYWNPDLTKCEPESREYLVKGKVKILKKR